jgi:hypothetical protein
MLRKRIACPCTHVMAIAHPFSAPSRGGFIPLAGADRSRWKAGQVDGESSIGPLEAHVQGKQQAMGYCMRLPFGCLLRPKPTAAFHLSGFKAGLEGPVLIRFIPTHVGVARFPGSG